METVLVVGSSGNVGVSVIIGALRSHRNVLAVVRNKEAADRIFHHVGAQKGITIAEADVLADDGVEKVVDKVRAGELPDFQHVYSAGLFPCWLFMKSR